MTYYDFIARRWHKITGFHGGAFKRQVLNSAVLANLSGIDGCAILELGAGNGYFMPLVLRRFSGQTPSRIAITDNSAELLQIAQRVFYIADAEYLRLDVSRPFPFPDSVFDLILANMLFNELPTPDLRSAIAESSRVLRRNGRLLATTVHPEFVESLWRRNQIRESGRLRTMPSGEGLHLPVAFHSVREYFALLSEAGFQVRTEEVYPTDKVLQAKPGLRLAGRVPVALLLFGHRA